MDYRETTDGAVPVVYCERQKKWLPIEEHAKCEYFIADVYDDFGEPVSFICTYHEQCKRFQPDFVDKGEVGYGAPVQSEDGTED